MKYIPPINRLMRKSNKPPGMAESLLMHCYTPSDVRKISVLEITETRTFDDAGFPIKGGLYDPAFGPIDRDSDCATCRLPEIWCPGHFGHFQLTVPLFNPLFYQFTFNLVKSTCIHCHRFSYNTRSVEAIVMIAQLRAINFGVTSIVDSLDQKIREQMKDAMSNLNVDEESQFAEIALLEEIDNIIAELAGMELAALRRRGKTPPTKIDCTRRTELMKAFLKDHLFKHKARCPLCKKANGKYRNDLMRAFIVDFSEHKQVVRENLRRLDISASKQKQAAAKAAENGKKEARKKALQLTIRDRRDGALDDEIRPEFGEEEEEVMIIDENLPTNKTSKVGPSPSNVNQRPTENTDSSTPASAKGGRKSLSSTAAPATELFLDPLEASERKLAEQLDLITSGRCIRLIWRASEVREHLRLLWKREKILLSVLFPLFNDPDVSCPLDTLFIDTLLIQPTKFRPIRQFAGAAYEHPTTILLRRVLEADQMLKIIKLSQFTSVTGMNQMAKELLDQRLQGRTLNEKLHNAYIELQVRLNCVFDLNLNKTDKIPQPGLRQLLEKKEGLFRMHMMGKRVNYACRSVITPDPYLDIDEIGIPDIFAKKLTLLEPVNPMNEERLKLAVFQGPDQYPGANFVEQASRNGQRQFIPGGSGNAVNRRQLWQRMRQSTEKLVQARKQWDDDYEQKPKDYVVRHLLRGDSLLMNRQPSLHKPSIMGHKARILYGQKALRMNYAPCKAYNADFDGDEMNGHFVQSFLAQCEAADLTNVGNNFLVPKDGTPILGLIQDHVVSGVLMTIRGRFFNREDFMHLVLSAFSESGKRLKIPPPSILKPCPMWSGKQVVTAIVWNCSPADRPLINLTSKAKTPQACWKTRDAKGNELPAPDFVMSESEVVFRGGELLSGVLDKAHFGASQFGLTHCCYELYGSQMAVQLLSCFSRVFTTYLQLHGFTLGVADILVNKKADKQRKKVIKELLHSGDEIVIRAFNLPEGAGKSLVHTTLNSVYHNSRDDLSGVKYFDFCVKQAMAKFNERINGACIPSGLIKPFPENGLQLMIQSGAKGSAVNAIQISCALGQIELEGQRPPISAVGRSLPSFRPYDPCPRAGGFVTQRFLTGIEPQEMFFHTMAGREGLIDTAVKTSRSGYLQRCLIKHLEGLRTGYDNTVRDHDNAVVQFLYGEDGMDVGRATFIHPKQLPFIVDNVESLKLQSMPRSKSACEKLSKSVSEVEKFFQKKVLRQKRRQFNWIQNHTDRMSEGVRPSPIPHVRDSAFLEFARSKPKDTHKTMILAEWQATPPEEQANWAPKHAREIPDTVNVVFNPSFTLASLPERFLEDLFDYLKSQKAKFGNEAELVESFKQAFYWRGLRSLVEPGECVGLLAAQSIGEPSTQMTLNTFHFAGRGEMNVTLGIPRLREILMTSGANIKTPTAEVCIRPGVSDETIERIKNELTPIYLRDLIKRFSLEEKVVVESGSNFRTFSVTIVLLSTNHREPNFRYLSRRQILNQLEKRFGRLLATLLGRRYGEVGAYMKERQLRRARIRALRGELGGGSGKGEEGEEGGGGGTHRIQEEVLSSDDEGGAGAGEADASEARMKSRHQDDAAEYEGEDQDKEEVVIEDSEDEFAVQDADDEPPEQGLGAKKALEGNESEEGEETEAVEDVQSYAQAQTEQYDRIEAVRQTHPLIDGYSFDVRSERWCTFKFRLPVADKTVMVDTGSLVEREVERFIVQECKGIEKCISREEQDSSTGRTIRILQTQGINLGAFYERAEWLDTNTIYSNDINLMLRTYGIEAAARTIVKEMNNVFGVYGIEVNPRHLILTADYMASTGLVQPFSRGAMRDSPSPLQKMTFETTIVFMREAILERQKDTLISPSSRIVVGQKMSGGTGSFDVFKIKRRTKGTKLGTKTPVPVSAMKQQKGKQQAQKALKPVEVKKKVTWSGKRTLFFEDELEEDEEDDEIMEVDK